MKHDQWIRDALLVVSGGDAKGIDLSQLRFTFRTTQSDFETPNSVVIRVYNMNEKTQGRIVKEFDHVLLEAGYIQGGKAVVFDGTIKQFRRGRESATDTYLDILAADGDVAYNYAYLHQTLPAGSTRDDRLKAYYQSMAQHSVEMGYAEMPTGGILPRGKVLYGMTKNGMRDLADTTVTSWSIQEGKLTMIPLTGYKPGEAVVLNSRTGMIGTPEATDNGVFVRCLLNPRIKIGQLVQIDNKSINELIHQNPSFPVPYDQWAGVQNLPSEADDGVYRSYVVEHLGDTRGQEWYTEIICLAADKSSPAGTSVKRFG